MGFRFYRRLRILPGVSVNLSKSGASMSFGVRGAHYTVGPRGRRVTVGLPGTGIFYTQVEARRRAPAGARGGQPARTGSAAPAPIRPAIAPADRLRLGFFRRLVTPPEEQALVDGLRALTAGDEDGAIARFRGATHLADGALLAGMLALKRGLLAEAETALRFAVDHSDRLGLGLQRYGVTSTVSVQITDDLTAHLPHTREGALLALVEVCQQQHRTDEAMRCLAEIRKSWPDDPVVTASLCELLLDGDPPRSAVEQVVALTDGVRNLTPVQTVLLLYRARALRALKLPDAAVAAATAALSRSADRAEALLHELRYERALAYGEAGDARKSRTELERLYAEDSTFSDVAARLGVTSGSDKGARGG